MNNAERQKCFEEIDYPVFAADELKGSILTYQDCLNLLPAPRTEQEILKDFEKLGYFVKKDTAFITLTNEYDNVIFIDLEDKCYDKSHYIECVSITMQEHKLLNELFQCWGWI
jgi:hypothetical protein